MSSSETVSDTGQALRDPKRPRDVALRESDRERAPLSERVGRHETCVLTVVIPARDEEADLPQVIRGVREVLRADARPCHEIVVVDDGSTDGTAQAARELGVRVVRHPYGIGNGAAVKAGLRCARGVVTVLLDGDGQHDPDDIPRLLEGLARAPLVVGARTGGGSSLHRHLANRAYNLLASYVANRRIPDLTSGFRAVRTDVARRFLYLLPNGFSYPSTLTLSLLRSGHPVLFVPVQVRKRRKGTSSKIKIFRDGSRFLLLIARVATFFSPLKVFLPLSLLVFGLGFGYYLYTYFVSHRFTNMGLLLLVLGALVLSLGLVSEQVASLRFEKAESGWEEEST